MAFEISGKITYRLHNKDIPEDSIGETERDVLEDDIFTRIHTMLIGGYVSGELYSILIVDDIEYEFKGYWELVYD